MIDIAERIKEEGLTQKQAAEVLHITQPRASALLNEPGPSRSGARIMRVVP